MKQIPIIDLFAGPGGLAEGFSSIIHNNKRIFDIKLSIEKDDNAYKTLLLRSFCRQFPINKLPNEYYKVVEAKTVLEREKLIELMYKKFELEYTNAKNEAWKCELGSEEYPTDLVDFRIKNQLGNSKEWVLIGGPPCQAYSLVGRSRVGGIDSEDHRVYLYKEYLRIIAKHNPSVFVMENVKGLLSAKVNNEKVFDWIKKDLQNPSSVFPNEKNIQYKIYSLSTPFKSYDKLGQPIYDNDKDFIIKSENYNIPQKRHRIILLGIREDLNIKPDILNKSNNYITLSEVIGDLPKIRSGLSKSYIGYELITKDKKLQKKRKYEKVSNTDKNWHKIYKEHLNELLYWPDFKNIKIETCVNTLNSGNEFVYSENFFNKEHILANWYIDKNLKGIPNHESRTHLKEDLKRYLFSSIYTKRYERFPKLDDYEKHDESLIPDHDNAKSGKFVDRFRTQLPNIPATTITSHISKDGHYFIHYDETQCRSLTVREAARIQTFPDNYVFCGSRTAQYHQVGNAVPPYLAYQIAQIVNNIMLKI
ncbi:DNA cytosine methyltransferase [Aliarcobacter butzleri]|uniref:DNA cytosine methyltransferase n=1 Tax=Aliarcobacter butzleri TaxID=28197 RepID=UPI00191A5225|nr:DNA (cytosine-5-)-methyltransferase [Aliarcobacter butzleri]